MAHRWEDRRWHRVDPELELTRCCPLFHTGYHHTQEGGNWQQLFCSSAGFGRLVSAGDARQQPLKSDANALTSRWASLCSVRRVMEPGSEHHLRDLAAWQKDSQ